MKRHSLAGADLKSDTVGGRALNDSALFTRTKIVDPAGTPAQDGSDPLAAVNSINGSGPANPSSGPARTTSASSGSRSPATSSSPAPG